MEYDKFEMIFENWQGFQQASQNLPKDHHIKEYYDGLFRQIRNIPEEKIERYLDEYFKKRLV